MLTAKHRGGHCLATISSLPDLGAFVRVAHEGPNYWQESGRAKGKETYVHGKRQPTRIKRHRLWYWTAGEPPWGPWKRGLGAHFLVGNGLLQVLSICASIVQKFFSLSSLAALSIQLSCTLLTAVLQLSSTYVASSIAVQQ